MIYAKLLSGQHFTSGSITLIQEQRLHVFHVFALFILNFVEASFHFWVSVLSDHSR